MTDPFNIYSQAPEKQRLEMIVFGEDWGAHPSSTQHLIKRLMPDHDVVWVNSLGLRRPRLTKRDIARATHKLGKMFAPSASQPAPQKLAGAPDIIHPRAVSWPGNPLAARLNRYLLGKQLEDVITDHNFSMPILWTSMPSAIDAIENYPNHKVVYYCGDDFTALAGVDHKAVGAMEQKLAERADLIIVASQTLQNRFPPEKTVLIEHGVDYDLFAQEAPRAEDLPDHPKIAGFYGSIHDWLDLDMIAHAAAHCPDWHFVFIGAVHVDISALQKQPNITFLGPRPHEDLPRYAQHWQLSLLPFKDCPQIQACNPLKLKEYLCAGRPIATTPFPAMELFRPHVHVMRNGADLVRTLRTLKPQDQRTSHNFMQAETWAHKAAMVEKCLLSLRF